MHFLTIISFSFQSFLASTTTMRLSMLAKVSDGEPSIGLIKATCSIPTPTLGKVLNSVRSAFSNCTSQLTNCGTYFFTILVKRPEEVIIATAIPTTISISPTMEARVMPVIFNAFFMSVVRLLLILNLLIYS